MELDQAVIDKLQNAMNRNQGTSKDLDPEVQAEQFEVHPFPKGMKEWSIYVGEDDRGYVEVSISSMNFHHDASLKLSGDFGSHDEKMAYAKHIQKLLNKES